MTEEFKEERRERLEQISNELTINEIGVLVAMKTAKMSQSKAKRYGLFPIADWSDYARMVKWDASYWDYSEVRFSDSRNDFQSLTEGERQALLLCFGFFAVGDGSITSLLAYQMILNSGTFEEQMLYLSQMNIERIHAITYNHMIEALIDDLEQRNAIFRAVEEVEAIKEMNAFIEDAILFPSGKADLYLALAISEYLFFTPLFAIIFWFKAYRKGKIKDVIYSNELIAKDECSHCANGCSKYLKLPKEQRFSDSAVHEMVSRAVGLVSNFARYMIEEKKVNLSGLTYDALAQYIRFIADDLLISLKHPALFKVNLPEALNYMTLTKFEIKTNFYEADVSAYRRFDPDSILKETKSLEKKFDGELSQEKKKKTIKF
jgi:ribonucleotide reductase beta subunit family protein with ferritin-like domain